MVTVYKSEWHQVEKRTSFTFDESILSEIYPDLEDEDIKNLLVGIQDGEIDIEELVDDAMESNVDLDWDFVDEDWWTERKGGYEVTYEVAEEESTDINLTPATAWPFPAGSPSAEIVDTTSEDEEQAILDKLAELSAAFEELEKLETSKINKVKK